jgi:hypothetical protein
MIKLKCRIWAHNFKKIKGFKDLVCLNCKERLHPFLEDEPVSELWKSAAKKRGSPRRAKT